MSMRIKRIIGPSSCRFAQVGMLGIVITVCSGQSCSPSASTTDDQQVLDYQAPALPTMADPIYGSPDLTPAGTGGGDGEDTGDSSTDGTAQYTLTSSTVSGLAPLAVDLEVIAVSGSLPADASYAWAFGDGAQWSGGAQATHVFTIAGSYDVTVCMASVSVFPDGNHCLTTSIRVDSGDAGRPNATPSAMGVEFTVDENTASKLTLTAHDADGDELSFRIVSTPKEGTLGVVKHSSTNSATVLYSPAADFTGTDWFSFTAGDGASESQEAIVRITVLPPAVPPMIGDRQPQWPLKTSRSLYTDAQIGHARYLCQTNNGKGLSAWVEGKAAYWASKSDQELHDLLPDARVPRDHTVSDLGCPIHGTAIYQHGTYPWTVDRDHPFTLICPVGGETYPSNDFKAYYESGMRDFRLLTGDYPDSGRGWVAPSGEKYWFVATACHISWNKWLFAIVDLSRAYVMTGDRTYARKAIVMLDRIAEVYPGMDYSTQSRYAELVGGNYPGKIYNRIWECGMLQRLSVAYDLVFDALIGPDAISLPWRSSQEIRRNIEANLLEEGIDAVDRGQIVGNFGEHQQALAYTVVVRQTPAQSGLLEGIMNATGTAWYNEGLNYAFYNMIGKDGMPHETSPFYCSTSQLAFIGLNEPLAHAGLGLFAHPRMRLMFDAPIELLCAGEFTPNNGDAGAFTDTWIGADRTVYEAGYRNYGDPRYAWMLGQLDGFLPSPITDFEDLFKVPVREQAQIDASLYSHQPPSRVLDGYGMAILNNQADSLAVSMYYGIRGGHGHYDRLNLELFGHGRRLAPDLGYPDFMNVFVSGIWSWSQNTISHNCLVVDETKQRGNVSGRVLRFHNAPTVHVVDVDATGSYAQASVYRRTLMLVDAGDDNGYLVDVFRVRGGTGHVLSIHGQEGTFELTGATLPSPVTVGTLAGADVAYGELYDSPKLQEVGATQGYTSYSGSGYSHLFNWQRVVPTANVTGIWRMLDDPTVQLRVHVPYHPGQEITVADAYVSPLQKIPTVLKYMLAHRVSDESGQTFVVIWEIAGGSPLIDRVELHDSATLGSGCDRTVALSVYRGSTVDTMAIAPAPGTSRTFTRSSPTATTFTSNSAAFFVSEQNGAWSRAFAAGGTGVSAGPPARSITVPATITGTVISADYTAKRVVIAASGVSAADAAALTGRSVRFFNGSHSCLYTIANAQVGTGTLTLVLTGSDVFTGRVKIQSVDAANRVVRTNTNLRYPSTMGGMTLLTEDLTHSASIQSITNGAIQLVPAANAAPFSAGLTTPGAKDAWIADFGLGDQAEIERFTYQGS